MYYKTNLAAAIAYLLSKGIIRIKADISKDLNLSPGTVSAYATGTTKMSSNFIASFESYYKIKLADYEHFVANPSSQKEPEDSFKKKYITALEEQIQLLKNHNEDLRTSLDALLKDKKFYPLQ